MEEIINIKTTAFSKLPHQKSLDNRDAEISKRSKVIISNFSVGGGSVLFESFIYLSLFYILLFSFLEHLRITESKNKDMNPVNA